MHLISSKGEYLSTLSKSVSCPHFSVEIARNINILMDIKSLIDLYLIFKLNKYSQIIEDLNCNLSITLDLNNSEPVLFNVSL